MSTTSKRRRKRVRLSPVDFQYASEQPDIEANLKLFPHQKALFDALTATLTDDQRTGIYILTSMTGSGKTIANVLPAVADGRNVILTYPTNTLVEDQYRSIIRDADNFGFSEMVDINRFRASDIRKKIQHTDQSVPEYLFETFETARLVPEATLFLTTPDTLYNIVSGKYWNASEFSQPMDRVHEMLGGALDYVVFDEFHIYGIEGTVSLLNLATLLQHAERGVLRLPLVFSSATSEEQLESWLKTIAVDDYRRFTDRAAFVDDGSHRIAGPVDLTIEFGPQWDAPEQFLATHHDRIRGLPSDGPLTAIFESATRTLELIDTLINEEPSVSEHLAYATGPKTSQQGLADSDTELQIGTRTLSVGVDFDTDYLYFESYRARDFLQKLGRVGRRGGPATAIAYTSEYALGDPTTLDSEYGIRREFETDLLEAMAQRQRVRAYGDLFGHLELSRMQTEYALSIQEPHSSPWRGQHRTSSAEYVQVPSTANDYLLAFRDPGTPQVAILTGDDVQFQNLFDVLRLYDIDGRRAVSRRRFLEKCTDIAPIPAHYINTGTITPVLYLEEEPPQTITRDTILGTERNRPPEQGLMKYTGDSVITLEVRSEVVPRKLRRVVNDRLTKVEPLLYIATQETFDDLRHALPHLFRTYPLSTLPGDEYRVAFGQNALKLWALAQTRDE